MLMAAKYKNTQKEQALNKRNEELSQEQKNRERLQESKDHIAFNFEYFTHGQNAGEDFCDWTHDQLIKLLRKMTEYSKKTKLEWLNEKAILVPYGDFRTRFGFVCPQTIPKEGVQWARYRMENKMRLIGFFAKGIQNIFYVVFLDKDHRFYPMEKP